MAFDSALADQVRKRIGRRAGLTEKRIFGGLAFLLKGNMCCGVRGGELLVRVDPAHTDRVLRDRHARLFALRGRGMKGWILVAPAGLKSAAALGKWVQAGVAYAGSLPAK